MYSKTRMTAILPYILICALSLKLIAPLLQAGFFEAHDALGHIYHSIEFNECLRQGVLLPGWFPDMYWGYGGPIMTFYPPLFYYSVLPFYWTTGSCFAALKIVIALGIVLSGISMYLFAREYWGKAGAVLSAVAYMYAPFHIADIYVRGAFPEAFLYPLLPLVFLLAKKTMTPGGLRAAALLSLLLGLSFLSHIMGFFALAFLAPFALLAPGRRNRRGILLLGGALILALGCTVFYWLPATLQKSFTHIVDIALSQYDWRDHFVYPVQLVSPSWGWGDSLAGPKDGMSFQVGIAHVAFILISIGALPFMRSGQRRVSAVFLAMTLISVFMMLSLSAPLWSKVPFLEVLQFPWRLLLFVNLFTSFLAGAVTCIFRPERKGARWIAAGAGIVFVMAASWYYCRAIYPNKTFGSEEECTPRAVLEKKMGTHELQYLPIWVRRSPTEIPSRKVVLEGAGEAEILESSVDGLTFRYSSPGAALGAVKIFYYPSWACRIDGRTHPLEPADQTGEILIRLPGGEHEVTLRYTTPPITVLARIISLVSVLAVVALILWKGKRESI